MKGPIARLQVPLTDMYFLFLKVKLCRDRASRKLLHVTRQHEAYLNLLLLGRHPALQTSLSESFLPCHLLRIDGYYCFSQVSTSLGVLRLALFADPPQFPEPLGRLKLRTARLRDLLCIENKV